MTIQPKGYELGAPQGTSVLEAIQGAAGHLPPDLLTSSCAGRGQCGRCRVRLGPDSQAPQPTIAERDLLSPAELLAGYRLACQLRPTADLTISIPEALVSGLSQLQVEGLDRKTILDPAVKRRRLDLSSSGPGAPLTWREVCRAAVQAGGEDACLVDAKLRNRITLPLDPGIWLAGFLGGKMVDLSPASLAAPLLGLAVDLGTTKVAGYLLDLESGRQLAAAGVPNPQLPFGEDVISRLGHARQGEDQTRRLAELATGCISRLAADLAEQAGHSPERIFEVVVAGNTAMHHLALGLPVEQLARAPYLPAVTEPMGVKARELGVAISPSGWVYFMPNIAGFVGGDAVAMALACGLDQNQGPALGIDIGTNTELILAHEGRLISASCPSGPAFEGGRVSCGLRAASGAICACRLGPAGEMEYYRTLDDAPAVGLCGSGLLELAAELVRHGALDERGLLDDGHPRVRRDGEGRLEYLLLEGDMTGHGRDMVITQEDLAELQLAKGAVYSGVTLLLEAAGLEPGQLREVMVAGAFGAHLDLEQAIFIKMLPRIPLERYCQVGNAAGSGARLALLSLAERQRAQDLALRAEHLELTTRPDFSRVFSQGLKWGEGNA